MQIKGFAHIWLVNHWYSIFSDQMRIILASGLYDACEEISIGCVGSPAEGEFLRMYFTNVYPKLKIKYYLERPDVFEFPTLQLICDDNSQYAGFYFHTKGVTRPFETVIQHWRATLNERVLNQWQVHYKNICDGYDVSSVNFMKSPDHFSGNFWWFNRDYINRLPPVSGLNHNNRFHAEQWACMGRGKFWYPEFKEPGDNCFKMQYK